jgi:hypothetical protein
MTDTVQPFVFDCFDDRCKRLAVQSQAPATVMPAR